MAYIRIILFAATLLISQLAITTEIVGAQTEEKSTKALLYEAIEKQDIKAIHELIETRPNELQKEVAEMVGRAMNPNISPEEADNYFNLAGMIATMFNKQTGDGRLLAAVSANYKSFLKRRDANALQPEAVEKTKKLITQMGAGNWRVNMFRMGPDGALIVEIDVRESSGASSFETPKISIKESQKVVEIIKTNLPKVKKGKVTWSSMGVGLKMALIE